MTDEEVMEHMEQIRTETGLSQSEMSRRLGYSRQRYNQWLKNVSPPPRVMRFFLQILKDMDKV